MYELYALLDPENNKIRYIGYTSNPKYRLKEHITLSIKGGRGYNSHRCKWIRKLLKNNKKPIYKTLLKTYSLDEIKQLEIDHIKYYKQFYKLTNNTLGGDGTKGLKWSEESKSKIKGRKIPGSGIFSKIEILNSKTGEYKLFDNKKEASKYIKCSEKTILSVSCGIRKRVYGWYVNAIKKGAQ